MVPYHLALSGIIIETSATCRGARFRPPSPFVQGSDRESSAGEMFDR